MIGLKGYTQVKWQATMLLYHELNITSQEIGLTTRYYSNGEEIMFKDGRGRFYLKNEIYDKLVENLDNIGIKADFLKPGYGTLPRRV